MATTLMPIACEPSSQSRMLFQGIKFLVQRRIPERAEIIEMIKTNGGILAKVEQKADMMITDHMRGCPEENSINWTFIRDSVQNGRLEDINNYKPSSKSNTPKNLKYKPSRKDIRVPFTSDDERILFEWCTDKDNISKYSNGLMGNKIFKALEKINNRHTFQSWRYHWKIMSSRRPQFSTEKDNKNQDKKCASMKKIVKYTNSENSNNTAEIDLQSHKNMRNNIFNNLASDLNSQDSVPKTDNFTESEANQLFDAYSQIIKVPEEESSEAWTQWAKTNPTHTAVQWKRYFYEVVKPKLEALIAENLRMRKRRVTTEFTTDQDELQSSILPSIDNTFETTDSQARPPQSLQFHDLADMKSQEILDDTVSTSESQLSLSDPMVHNEYLFRQGLRDLADELELDVDFSPEICGRKISLMKLWKTVRSPRFGGFKEMKGNENWRKLAESFGFIDHNNLAAKELEDCYSEILAELEFLRHEFLIENSLPKRPKKPLIENLPLETSKISSEDSINSESMDSVMCETQSICNYSIDLDSLQTPEEPQKPVKKRGINLDLSPKRFIPNKRPRISNDKNRVLEIPSTPESIINFHQNPNLARRNSLECVSTSKIFDEIDALSPSPSGRLSNIHNSVSNKSVSRQVIDSENQKIYFTRLSQEAYPLSRLRDPDMVEDKEEFPLQTRKKEKQSSATQSFRIKSKNVVDLIKNGLPLQESLVSNTNEEKSPYQNVSECELGESSLCLQQSEMRVVDQVTPLSSQCVDNESQMHKEEKIELDEFVEVQISLGFSLENIVRALESTSMIIGPGSHIDTVLKIITETGCIPEDLPGVWTISDDEILKQSVVSLSSSPSYDNSEAMELLIRKHGSVNIQLRQDYWKYVEYANQEQMMTIDDGS